MHCDSWSIDLDHGQRCVKCYPDPTWQYGLMARMGGGGGSDLRLKVLTRPWVTGCNCVSYLDRTLQKRIITRTWILGTLCVYCDLDLGDMTLSQRLFTP